MISSLNHIICLLTVFLHTYYFWTLHHFSLTFLLHYLVHCSFIPILKSFTHSYLITHTLYTLILFQNWLVPDQLTCNCLYNYLFTFSYILCGYSTQQSTWLTQLLEVATFDPISYYYLKNTNYGLLVNNILREYSNYYHWSREMTIILITKRKFGFVLGTLKSSIRGI